MRVSNVFSQCSVHLNINGIYTDGGDLKIGSNSDQNGTTKISVLWFSDTSGVYVFGGDLLPDGTISGTYNVIDHGEDIRGDFLMSKR